MREGSIISVSRRCKSDTVFEVNIVFWGLYLFYYQFLISQYYDYLRVKLQNVNMTQTLTNYSPVRRAGFN